MATYMTIGQVKTVKLPDCTFTIEPLSDYRFKAEDGKDDTWQIIFEPKDGPTNGSLELKLVDKDSQFKLKCGGTAKADPAKTSDERQPHSDVVAASGFASAMVVLKTDRTKVRLSVEELTNAESNEADGSNGADGSSEADNKKKPIDCTVEIL